MQEELTKVLDNCFGIDERSVGFLPTYETVEQEKAQQAHHYAGIDESGYFSSISSLYEVPSDDENYNDYNENFNEFGSVCISSALFLFFTSFILYSNQLPNCDFSNSGQPNRFMYTECGTSSMPNKERNDSTQDTATVVAIESEDGKDQQNSSNNETTRADVAELKQLKLM